GHLQVRRLMVGVFAINVYIGLYDKTLAQYSPTHLYANWVIAIVDLAAATVLLSNLGRNERWVFPSGIGWPVAYIISLVVDIMLDLGAPNLWPDPASAYKYLILADPNQGWVLWKYTIPAAILLLILVVVLSSISLAAMRKKSIRNGAHDLTRNDADGMDGR
ncbi:MAG: hypothetical protein M1368_00935, partial [Thaumarchaeota archaeon]|nr:hypothetical protein [Nitrososphaerota archaeon]